MGNSLVADDAVVSRFYSDRAWIEGAATKQLSLVAGLEGCLRVAAFPDLHPGKYGPVGIAADFDGVIHPGLIGTDIGCGVALACLDLPTHRLKLDKAVDALSDVMAEEFEETLEGVGLGSIGGGNHFLELTVVKEVVDPEACALRKGDLHVLVHTGSRSLGADIFDAHHQRHGLAPVRDDVAEAYMGWHERAMAFARANREAVCRRVGRALRSDVEVVSDVPHNHVERIGGTFRHRKGASSADRGDVVVLGSRGSLSWLVRPLPGMEVALASLAHGSGRKLDRASARARFGGKGVVDRESRSVFGGRVVCNDKDLAAEEAAGAYKPIAPVIEDLVAFGIARPICSLQPVLTWKTAGERR